MYGYYFDPTYILLVIGMVLSLAASARVKSTFAIYNRVRSASGLTGAEAASRILHMAGITDVSVVPIAGSLTDHYDPRSRQIALSQDVYDKTSVAAIGVAAHECGHAIQDSVNYVPLNFRTAHCSCGEYRVYVIMALISGRTDLFTPSAADTGNPAVFTGCTFSVGDTACRVQCFFQSTENDWQFRNAGTG